VVIAHRDPREWAFACDGEGQAEGVLTRDYKQVTLAWILQADTNEDRCAKSIGLIA